MDVVGMEQLVSVDKIFVSPGMYLCFFKNVETSHYQLNLSTHLGKKTTGFDCVVIPGAEKTDGTAIKGTKQCGRTKGLVTQDDGTSQTVCSRFLS